MTLSEIRARLLELMTQEKALYDSLLQRVVALGERAFAVSEGEASVYLDGTSNILSQPEFDDLERMRALFRTFEEKSRLVRILNACIAGDGIRVAHRPREPGPRAARPLARHRQLPRGGRARLRASGCWARRGWSTRTWCRLVDHVARAVSDVLRGSRA